MKKKLTITLALMTAALGAKAQYIEVTPNPYGERPVIVPVPTSTAGVEEPVVTLDGDWDRTENTSGSDYSFLKTVSIPEAFKGKRIVIRFSNLTQDVSFEVNGQHVRNYWGVSGAWTADITELVHPGSSDKLSLRIRRSDGLGKFVRFTPRIAAGTQIYALPEGYIERMRMDTDFDESFKDATLTLWLRTNSQQGGSVKIAFSDSKGRKLSVTPSTIALPRNMDEFKYELKLRKPAKWDAEHPQNLYKMTLSLLDAKGRTVETIERKYGFRELELKGNRLLLNGQELKFRGAWGCNSASQLRDMNVNHTRQKWASEQLLDDCDEYGIYVLDENAVDFAKFGAEIDPRYEYQWIALMQEKIERDYNHPSVVMWGIGNESFHGPNVLAAHRYCKAEDPVRPTMFSWANRVRPDEEIPYDVYSFHYSPDNADLSSYGKAVWHSKSLLYDRAQVPVMPVIVDEATHICISDEELARDPNVRNFWGESLKDFWQRSWNTPGSLGGDQFGIFRYINSGVPEIWHFRKAYSPFVISQTIYATPAPGEGLRVMVENRFNHSNLSETSITWKVGEAGGVIAGPSAKPHATGEMLIPYRNFKDGDIVELAVCRADGVQVDEYRLEVGVPAFRIPALSGKAPDLKEDYHFIDVSGEGWTLRFDKFAGQITDVSAGGKTVITGGPHLQLLRSGLDVGEYWPQSIKARIEGSEAVIDMDVIYSPIEAAFQLRIDGSGLMTVHYTIKHTPDAAPEARSLMWNTADRGGYSEVGVRFSMPSSVDRLEWERKGLWSTYPEDHIGRLSGVAFKKAPENTAPRSAGGRQAEARAWKDMDYDIPWTDSHWGIQQRENRSGISNDFRASKEYIRRAAVLLEGSGTGVEALSEEHDAVRLEVTQGTGAVTLFINNEWNYPTLGIGNYMKPAINIGDGYTNTVHLRIVKND